MRGCRPVLSGSFRCSNPGECDRWARDILALGPAPTRSEFEQAPLLARLSAIYGEEGGIAFVQRLERFVAGVPEILLFSRMPTQGQLCLAIDQAYSNAQLDDLHRLLKAYRFYQEPPSDITSERLNAFSGHVARGLTPWVATRFCAGCGALEAASSDVCRRCGSEVLTLSCFEIDALARKGLEMHIPSELYCSAQLESAGYHLVRAGKGGRNFGISLTFNAFGAKVDIDAVGIGHPPCVLLLLVTTSRVDQGKAMAVKGTADNLKRLLEERYREMPPLHVALVAMGGVDGNLDLLGVERVGMTIFKEDQISTLAEHLAKIPFRLTT